MRRLQALALDGIGRLLAVERSGAQLVVIREWCEGVDLGQLGGVSLDDFFGLASRIVARIAEIHGEGLIHGALKPGNLIVEPNSGEVSIVDLGTPTLLEADLAHVNDPAVVSGTLPYVSPEQTGRTHREVDSRTDLYSLGVTFYQLLVGRHPFVASSSLELIHAHLARRPEAPSRLRPDIPEALSNIVMKLLEKEPEQRYQSARGLGLDLARVAAALRGGQRLDDFETGSGDVSLTLQLPHRLYGRTREVESLTGEFRRAASGVPRLALVTGPDGVGKTALISALREPVIARHGYLARATFERELGNRPYAGFLAAFDDLAGQLLTESDAQLDRWRRELGERLGTLAGPICELVPRLRAILGSVPTPPQLGPVESHNRLALACTRLVAAFARVEHPLVIALDDLHWAEASSCELLAAILAEPNAAVLVVASLNAHELHAGHPLRESLARIDRAHMLWLELGPLAQADATEFIADALTRPVDEVHELAEIVGRRTHNTPHGIRQFLAHLVERRLLRPTSEGWTWDRRSIEQSGIPDDLVALVSDKLDRLDAATREVLTTAAVLGARFSIATLSRVVDDGEAQLAPALARLMDDGLLAWVGSGRCAFTHDRLRALAYQSSELMHRAALHRDVGRILLGQIDRVPSPDAVYEIVEHMDLGLGLIPLDGESSEAAAARATRALEHLSDLELIRLARLNSLAAQRALVGVSATTSVGYALAGVRLLKACRAALDVGLAFELELVASQALAFAGQRERARASFDALLRRPIDPVSLGLVVVKQVESSIRLDDRPAALADGVAGLVRLGFEIPSAGTLAPLLDRLDDLRALARRPRVELPRVAAALDILDSLVLTAHRLDVALHRELVSLHLNLCLEYGRHPTTPPMLAQFALALAKLPERLELAVELVGRARALAESEGPACRAHRVELAHVVLTSWSGAAAVLEPLHDNIARALEHGDIEYAGDCTAMQSRLDLAAGIHLRALGQRCEVSLLRLEQWGVRSLLPCVRGHLEFARMLESGLEEAVEPLDAADEDPEQRMLSVRLLYLFGRHDEAWATLQASRESLAAATLGAWSLAALLGFEGLLAAARYARVEPQLRPGLLAVVERNAAQLRLHANTPNLDAMASLLEAELAGIRGPIDAALRQFGRARRTAAACDALMIEAIALERLAAIARAADLIELADGPLRDARERYREWGALSKVAALERAWPQLRAEQRKKNRPDAGAAALDISSILKTSQTIAEDIRLEEVIGRVLAIGLENAGADRAALLLCEDDRTQVVAICTAEHGTRSFLREPMAVEDAGDQLPVPILHFVERTREVAVIDDVSVDPRFARDPYIERAHVRSVLCLPILKQTHFVGLLYLENKLSPRSFSGERIEFLNLLVAQAASMLENARLYEALRASEVRWRSLVEGLPDIVMLVDRRGRIEFINHASNTNTRPKFSGQLLVDQVADEFMPTLRIELGTVFEDGRQVELDLRASFLEPKPRWYTIRIAPIVDGDRIERAIVVGTDITERREAEAVRARLDASLRQQQRLESIGTLASGVAHEINNPIQGIMNYAELIGGLADSGPGAREFAGEINHEANRVATIVRNLLEFSRHERSVDPRLYSVADIIEGTRSLIHTLLRKDMIALEVDLAEGLPDIECEIQQIQQVVMNLVTNSRDALRVRYPDYHEDKRIVLRASAFERAGAPWVRICVEDRGGGVPLDIVDRVFDPFFTTKGRAQGTGLGLAVSHGIIAEHGGELRLDNHPGESASFRIELPVRCDAALRQKASRGGVVIHL